MRRCGGILTVLLMQFVISGGAAERLHDSAVRQTTPPSYYQLPLHFEPNLGQTDPRVSFVAKGPGYVLFLSPSEVALKLSRLADPDARNGSQARTASALKMLLVGARSGGAGRAEGRLPGRANYLKGPDPALWTTGVPFFRRARFEGVYPGVDVVYYGAQDTLEYDFVVAPGADPRAIRFEFEGVRNVRRDAGRLVLVAGPETVTWRAPVAYQQIGGRRVVVPSRWATDGTRAWFRLGRYDRSHPLVIDPQLVYSTYVGGQGRDAARDIAIDDMRCAYITGATDSIDFPTNPTAFQPAYVGGLADAFVTKLDPSGSAIIYSTYLGSQGEEWGHSIDVNPQGFAYVTGWTDAVGFPVTPGCFDATFNGGRDAFVTLLDPPGAGLIYSTYLGGGRIDEGREIRWGEENSIHVDGFTESQDFPITLGCFDPSYNGLFDAFYTKLVPKGQGFGDLLYSTFIGGEANDYGLCMDLHMRAIPYIGGSTESVPFPLSQAPFQPFYGGSTDAFLVVLVPSGLGGADLRYGSYLGGHQKDECYGIAVHPAGHCFMTGMTESPNFPTGPGAFQPFLAPPRDAFVSRVFPNNAGAPDLQASTYLGGPGNDEGHDIDVDDPSDEPYLTGFTDSQAFPITTTAFQPVLRGPMDAFVTRMVPFLNVPIYSTYLGGDDVDRGYGIILDGDANAYVCGATDSVNYPVTPAAFDTSYNGARDGFVTKMGIGRATDLSVVDTNGAIGATVTLKAQLTYSMDGSPIAGKSIAFEVDGTAVGSGTTDAAGSAAVSHVIWEGAGPGARTIKASFAGDASAAASIGTGTLRVTKSNTSVTVPDRTGTITESVRLRALLRRLTDLAWLPSKTITFKIDGTTVGTGTTDAAGAASFDWVITNGPASRTITGDFAGDTWYNASSGTGTLRCLTHATKCYAQDRTGKIADQVLLRGYLFRLDNTPVIGKTLRFKIDGSTVGTAVTGGTGRAQRWYTIPEGVGAGSRVIRVEWDGDGGYSASADDGVLTVQKAPTYLWVYTRSVKVGQTLRARGYLRRLPDYAILVGKTVSFDIDGTTLIGSAVTDGTGWATVLWVVPAGFPTGPHTLNGSFAGDGAYDPDTGATAFTVVP